MLCVGRSVTYLVLSVREAYEHVSNFFNTDNSICLCHCYIFVDFTFYFLILTGAESRNYFKCVFS